eukprot:2672369-Amphidinium_carterae.2
MLQGVSRSYGGSSSSALQVAEGESINVEASWDTFALTKARQCKALLDGLTFTVTVWIGRVSISFEQVIKRGVTAARIVCSVGRLESFLTSLEGYFGVNSSRHFYMLGGVCL